MLRIVLAVCLLFVCPLTALAEPSLTPGFRTLGVWDEGRRMDVALWYPAMRAPTETRYNDWTLRVARGAKALEGRHPLIVLSHDSASSRFALHPLAAALARSGFVVAAVTHRGDNTDDMNALFTPAQITGRVVELRDLVSELLASSETAPLIDEQRIGVLGVGPGGSAALLMGGARLDKHGWPSYCGRTTPGDPYCTPWTGALMEQFAATPRLGVPWRDPRIKAVAAVAPAYGMFFTKAGLSGVTTPVLVLQADLDSLNIAPHHANAIATNLPKPPVFKVLRETDTASLLAQCSANLQKTLPELCGGATPARRERTFNQLADHSVRFFLTELGPLRMAATAPEPPLPELNAPPPPPPPKAPEPAKRPTRPQRR